MPIIPRLLQVETTFKSGIRFLNKFYSVTLSIKIFGASNFKDHFTQATNKNNITPQLPGQENMFDVRSSCLRELEFKC